MTKFLLIIIGVLSLFIFGALVYFFALNPQTTLPQKSTPIANSLVALSGVIDINGIAPAGASVAIGAREVGMTDFTTVAQNIPAVDGTAWSWESAKAGVAYEIQGTILSGEKKVDQSEIVTIVAPSNQAIVKITTTTPPTTPLTRSISGKFNFNGYIPPGATITIGARKVGDLLFSPALTGLAATDHSTWSWTNAQAGQAYDIQAYVQQGAATIASSGIQTITAPATNETLTLNSTLTPPTPAVVSISGTWQFSGPIPENSTVSLAIRPSGTTKFDQVFSGVSASNGATWSWNNAASGSSYDIQGYLWVSGVPYSQSPVLTVTAPAANEILSIQAQTPAQTPPGGTITASCGNEQNNMYQVNIAYNTQGNLNKPQQYRVTLGYSVGTNELWDATSLPSNPTQAQNMATSFVLAKGTTAFAQYAYSTCANCGTYSSFSPSSQVQCN